MSFDRLYYELKLMGKKLFLTPLLIILISTVLSLWMKYGGHVDPARFLLAVAEIILPLATGIIIGTIIAVDPALELQLTFPRKNDATGILRVTLVFVLMMLCALIFISVVDALKLIYLPTFMDTWSPMVRFLVVQMIWFAPLLWCMVVGFCFALLMQSRTAAGALLGCIWVAEIIFKDYIALTPWLRPILLFPFTLVAFPATSVSYDDYITYGLSTRLELLITAVVLFPLGWLLLRNTDRMLKGVSAE
jgi:hypothetical protein